MRKMLVNAVLAGLVAVGGVGCGQSLEAARADAESKVAGMLYLDDPTAVRSKLAAASTTKEIQQVVEAAAKEDQERAEAYWTCAETAAKALPGTSWEANIWHEDGSMETLQLALKPGEAAQVTPVRSRMTPGPMWRPSSQPTTTKAVWIAENASQLTGWSSDLPDLVASRTLADRQPPVFSPINKSCDVQFKLTLVTSSGSAQFSAKLMFSGTSTLILDGQNMLEKKA